MKKVLPLFFGVLLAIVITGCLVKGVFNPSHLGINSDPALTIAAKSLIGSYSKLFSEKNLCRTGPNGDLFYSVDSTMPADQYLAYKTSSYAGKKLTYVTTFSTNDYPDYFRTIWDCADIGFTYYGACVPNNVQFPYPCTGEWENDVFLNKLVPVSDFQKLKLDTVWSNSKPLKGLAPTTIKTIVGAYLEEKTGFINTNYPNLYTNKSSCLGIICIVELKNGTLLPCYLVTNDLNGPASTLNPAFVLWKN